MAFFKKSSNTESSIAANSMINQSNTIDSSLCGSTNISVSPFTIGSGSIGYGVPVSTLNSNISTINFRDFQDDFIEIISYLSEEELNSFLKSISDRLLEKNESFKNIINRIVSERHFSEEFLLEHVQYLNKLSILKQHKSDINSQQYPQIALLLMNME